MAYTQITYEERVILSTMRTQGYKKAEIARFLGRHRSSIGREIERNLSNFGIYRYSKAQEKTNGRRRRSRKKFQFSDKYMRTVIKLLKKKWSPEQISDHIKKSDSRNISHETIYAYVWHNRFLGGNLYTYLRQGAKKRRKRYRTYDSRGQLAGKRHISERPAYVEARKHIGHWEIDTVMGAYNDKHCILTMVERKTGFVLIGKLRNRTKEETGRVMTRLIRKHQSKMKTLTADNGTEFHGYADVEKKTHVKFYFATPYHSWERGLNENTNGLIRQYLPKKQSMANISQRDCDNIAKSLNTRPRKRLGFKTPEQCYGN